MPVSSFGIYWSLWNILFVFTEPCQYRCIECGYEAVELYKDFKAGIIKISHCVSVTVSNTVLPVVLDYVLLNNL